MQAFGLRQVEADRARRAAITAFEELRAAQNAQLKIDGIAISRKANSNLADIIEGVSLNLLKTSQDNVETEILNDNDAAKKQVLSFVINVTAAVFFVVSSLVGDGKVRWGLAAVMSVGSILGGLAGGKFVGRLDPDRFRWIVVAVGAVLSLVYAYRVYL